MCDFSEYGIPSDDWVKVEATLPPFPDDLSIEKLKNVTNAGRQAASEEEMKELSSKVSLQDFSVPTRDGATIEARTYRSSSVDAEKRLPIYLHFHGGGFFFGTLSGEDATCSRIAIDVEAVVVNVNYRHTPEFVYPTAWNDSEDALAWVYDHAHDFGGDNSQIIVGGISAGAFLTNSLMHTLQLENNPMRKNVLGQVLMIPPAVHPDCNETYVKQLKDPSLSSLKQCEFAPVLPVSRIRFFNEMLFPNVPLSDDRRANPGLATPGEVAKLPPATFGVAGLDPLRDEGLLYAKLLQENGVPTNVNVFKGVPHGFRRFGDKLAASKAWDEVMHEGIRWALNKPLPSSVLDIHVY